MRHQTKITRPVISVSEAPINQPIEGVAKSERIGGSPLRSAPIVSRQRRNLLRFWHTSR